MCTKEAIRLQGVLGYLPVLRKNSCGLARFAGKLQVVAVDESAWDFPDLAGAPIRKDEGQPREPHRAEPTGTCDRRTVLVQWVSLVAARIIGTGGPTGGCPGESLPRK